MNEWAPLYSVTSGSAATLLGLLFVAVSINASATLNSLHRNSSRLAEQAFQNYVVVMVVSLLALFPALNIREYGFVVLGLTSLRAVWALNRLFWAAKEPYQPGERFKSLRRQLSSLIGMGLMLYAALRMAFEIGDPRLIMAVATIVLLFAATALAWELLLRIAADKKQNR